MILLCKFNRKLVGIVMEELTIKGSHLLVVDAIILNAGLVHSMGKETKMSQFLLNTAKPIVLWFLDLI